ncbi:MAG: YwiC-like family protein [Anaerolinea sp.]|nr:YwiC-like family protein [Anaerolinea sp.]MCC6972426.1 YwiC-like family protein [Anaerolineae bacterium]
MINTAETSSAKTPAKRKSAFRSVALPAEHGGWGFLLEPILLGLIAFPSWAGLALGVAASGVFLLDQPLKIAVKDSLRGKRYPRTALAERMTMVYGGLAVGGLILALMGTAQPFWGVIFGALPLALLKVIAGTQNQGRALSAEIGGALALAGAAAAITLAGGASLTTALAAWLALGLRDISSILYVRARLRLLRGEPTSVRAALIAHLIGLVILLGITIGGVWNWLAPLAGLILLIRAGWWLRADQPPVRAPVVGFQEMTMGITFALLVGISI